MRLGLLVPPALAVLAASAVLGASSPRQAAGRAPHERIDLSKVGPKIGERVPDFSLPDQTGATRTLQSIMGPKGAMLVFFRSADW